MPSRNAGAAREEGDENEGYAGAISPKAPQAQREERLVALGERLRRLRRERKYSQEDFALAAGIARTYYGEVERGERNVAALNLMKIALTLGVEVGELFPSLEEIGRMSLSREAQV